MYGKEPLPCPDAEEICIQGARLYADQLHEFALTETRISPVMPDFTGVGCVAEAEAVQVPVPVWVTVKIWVAIVTVPVR